MKPWKEYSSGTRAVLRKLAKADKPVLTKIKNRGIYERLAEDGWVTLDRKGFAVLTDQAADCLQSILE